MEERLQKFMARCGVASRRKCEEIILSGKVKVNGNVILELGTKVTEGIDSVEYNGKIIKPEENKVYFALNKPVGYISSVKDERNRPTIIDLVNVKERIYPVGRLDYDSSGVLILTNDGDIYNKIIHPKVELYKKYIVEVEGEFLKEELEEFRSGVDIGGYITAPALIDIISYKDNKTTVEIGIHEGKNRQIRRMCALLNHQVISLNRISIGDIKLGDLKLGEYRYLTKEELDYINNL